MSRVSLRKDRPLTRNPNFLSNWTSHLKTKDEKEHFERSLRDLTTSPQWKRLQEIVLAKKKEIEDKERQGDYTDASWSHKQAHTNGQLQELTFILKLIGA